MIVGYVYRKADSEIEHRLRQRLPKGSREVPVWENGFFLSSAPFHNGGKVFAASGRLVCVSEDLLVGTGAEGTYRQLEIEKDISADFLKQGPDAFRSIQSDFRMAVAAHEREGRRLYLASNRAGSGRIYYHRLESGILFLPICDFCCASFRLK